MEVKYPRLIRDQYKVPRHPSVVNANYNMRKAQANPAKLCRSGRRFVITTRNLPVVASLRIEDFEALMETLDVLADPADIKVVQGARPGKTKFRTLGFTNDNFGL